MRLQRSTTTVKERPSKVSIRMLLLLVVPLLLGAQANAGLISNFGNGIIGGIESGINGFKEVTMEPVPKSGISFTLVKATNLGRLTEFNQENAKICSDAKGKIYIIIHGWLENKGREWYKELTEALAKKDPEGYIIQVDWRQYALKPYSESAYYTESVGEHIADLIVKLHRENKVPVDKFVLIGHSLGGQIAGWTGKKFTATTGLKLARIVALDPAGPLFVARADTRRLCRTDAEVVEVIHTDGGKFGLKGPCGTIDFFPNAGSNQPGCYKIDVSNIASLVDPPLCDHARSWEFMIEAVKNPKGFLGIRCAGWEEFKSRRCDKKTVSIGDLTTTATGTFYLETKPSKPFAKDLLETHFSS